ncbi:hypothetical protein EC973_003395 [Apophysomyces ossiformis]|uniref:Zn(2)-C6 fungal-type domain-containing protein n=1 Tax=Apophysomyces ossiformis TaxID=679940 RepID=A0A8H7BXJ6_9FUNG|nr:hypothetical protein EC973_003395 [Apophysomyces ossiformis]
MSRNSGNIESFSASPWDLNETESVDYSNLALLATFFSEGNSPNAFKTDQSTETLHAPVHNISDINENHAPSQTMMTPDNMYASLLSTTYKPYPHTIFESSLEGLSTSQQRTQYVPATTKQYQSFYSSPVSQAYRSCYFPGDMNYKDPLGSRPATVPEYPLTPPMDSRQFRSSPTSSMESAYHPYTACSYPLSPANASQVQLPSYPGSMPTSFPSTLRVSEEYHAPSSALMEPNSIHVDPTIFHQLYPDGSNSDLAISSSSLSSSSSSFYVGQGSTSGEMNQGMVYVRKACVGCKASHVACDAQRPCIRCIRLNKACECVDAERKKRGRPCGSGKKMKSIIQIP